MGRTVTRLVWWLWIAALGTGAMRVGAAEAGASAGMGADAILRRFLERAREAAGLEAGCEVTYRRRTRIDELQRNGAVKESQTRLHSVTNRGGRVRAVLVKVGDRDVSSQEALSDRKLASDARRESGRRRSGPDYLDAELVNRFDFELEGEEMQQGRRVYRLRFVPKQESRPGRDVDRILGLLEGTMWIDATEFELVRVDARLRSPLKLLGGFAGAINRLEFGISREPVVPGYWANRRLVAKVDARKLAAGIRMNVEVEQDSFEVRRLGESGTPGSF